MKQTTINGLKRAAKEAVYFFLLPLIASCAIGKGIFEYMMWVHEATKASGWSGMQALAVFMSPFIVGIFIFAVGMFYWLNNRINK